MEQVVFWLLVSLWRAQGMELGAFPGPPPAIPGGLFQHKQGKTAQVASDQGMQAGVNKAVGLGGNGPIQSTCDVKNIKNGGHTASSTNTVDHGKSVTYHCSTGYRMAQGQKIRKCEYGTLKGDQPVCLIVECKVPKDIGNSQPKKPVVNKKYVYLTEKEHTCKTGYKLTGNELKYFCNAKGDWEKKSGSGSCTPVTCSAPQSTIGNAKLKSTAKTSNPYNTQVTYVCKTGYKSSAPITYSCKGTGQWQSDVGSGAHLCRAVTCQQPYTVNNAQVKTSHQKTTYQYSDKVVYVCNPGYKRQGSEIGMQCNAAGEWTSVPSNPGSCKAVQCSSPPSVSNANVRTADIKNTKYVYQDQITYECGAGYKLSGSAPSYKCDASGKWSLVGTAGTCQKLCSVPSTALTSSTSSGYVGAGTTVAFSCKPPNIVKGGSSSRGCQSDGSWTGTDFVCREPKGGNLAYKKKAYESSTWGLAGRAVDGNKNTVWSRGGCSHTAEGRQYYNAWWGVDLGAVYNVKAVSLTNRGDCCSYRLSNFHILVSNRAPIHRKQYSVVTTEICHKQSGAVGAGRTQLFKCMKRNLFGRYVVVRLTGRYPLALCEVEVFEVTDCAVPNTPHVTASATGNVNFGQSVTFTCKSPKVYQEGDWKRTCLNTGKFSGKDMMCRDKRSDECSPGDVPSGVSSVTSTSGRPQTTVSSGSTLKVKCADPKLHVSGDTTMTCRNGKLTWTTGKALKCRDRIAGNLAYKKKAYESSTWGLAGRAVDGNKNTVWSRGGCSHTAEGRQYYNAWWGVDLGKQYGVKAVSLTNRADCCSYRLSNFHILVGNRAPQHGKQYSIASTEICHRQYSAVGAGRTQMFKCANKNLFGQYVVVRLTGRYPLTLCEVEVFEVVDCTVPTLPNVGTSTTGSVNFGQSVSFQCKNGKIYQEGDLKRTCLNTGKFSGKDMKCRDKRSDECGVQGLPSGASAKPSSNGKPVKVVSAGSSLSVQCADPKVRESGDTTMTCDKSANLKWTNGKPLKCRDRIRGNLALRKKAYESSSWGYQQRANDGNRNTYFSRGSCSHTGEGSRFRDPWWGVDLGKQYHVKYITLTNRGDCCYYRLQKITGMVGDRPPKPGSSYPIVESEKCFYNSGYLRRSETRRFTCIRRLFGRYVVIRLTGGYPLALCEVQVQEKL